MGLCQRLKDFWDGCPQPPDPLPAKLKHYSVPIAAVVTAALILSVSFFVFSLSLASTTVPIAPVVNVASRTNPTLLWNFTANQDVVSSPVVADGLLYATSVQAGGSPVTLFCINASTGVQVWSTTGTFLNSALANGYVYVTQAIAIQPPSPALPYFKGPVSCLNAYNGAKLWNCSYGTNLGAPIVAGSIVYVGGNNYTLNTRTFFGNVYAIDSSTGAQIWNFTGPKGSNFDSLIITNGHAYALSTNGIFTLNAATGKELWNYTTAGQFGYMIASGNCIYVSSNAENSNGNTTEGGILALNASNGSGIWSYPIDSSVATPTVTNSTVYAAAVNGDVYALHASNGKLIWKYSTGLNVGSPFLVDGYLYVGTSAGVYCFNSYNGAVIWKFSASDFAGSSATNPLYARGVIYVGWNGPVLYSPVIEHNFYALEASNGKTVWNYTIGYTVKSSPAAADGTVYIPASYADPHPDELNEMPGAVIALTSEVASLPLPTLPVSEPAHSLSSTTIAVIIAGVITLITIVTGVFMLRKRLKTKSSPPAT